MSYLLHTSNPRAGLRGGMGSFPTMTFTAPTRTSADPKASVTSSVDLAAQAAKQAIIDQTKALAAAQSKATAYAMQDAGVAPVLLQPGYLTDPVEGSGKKDNTALYVGGAAVVAALLFFTR